MIEFSSSDSTIWNLNQLIVDIAQSMSQKLPRIDIFTRGEGPCARSLGLYNLLDILCDRFNYSASNIYITTCNLAETHDRYRIIIKPQVVYLKAAQRYTPPSGNKQIAKHFGHFIGHGNYPRLYLGSYLHHHYPTQTVQTYHTCVTDHYHRPFIGLEDMMFYGHTWDEINNAMELLKVTPITIDSIDQYPIINPITLNITKVYSKFFVEIVNLTYWSGDVFYIDEKIWRPILMRTPFIVHGPKNFLSRLRALGFQTFEPWWDEGYGEDPPDHQLKEIVHIVEHLGNKSIDKLTSMYAEMQPLLEHNFQRLMKIQKQDLHA